MTLDTRTIEEDDKTAIPRLSSGQKISQDGRIYVNRKGWVFRGIIISALIAIIAFTILQGLELGDYLVVYSALLPIQSFMVLTIGWIFYRNISKGETGNKLVSVIIPIYNQESIIEFVIDAIYQSTYENIEVIAINDGSQDKTGRILDRLVNRHPKLKVIHKKNMGKRKAIATGFYESKGEYVVMIDSDSIIGKKSIMEIVRTFESDPKIGSAVGHVKVFNSHKNLLTKCQDAWYDFSFNIQKAAESFFGCVFCCSGALAAYRRNAIAGFIPYWEEAVIQYSDDRQLTNYVIAPSDYKTKLRKVFGKGFWTPVSQKLMEAASQYDDAEDRSLTAHALTVWKSVYVASAITYTDVPENWRGFLRQQTRWKKGTIRTNFFVSAFFWRKNPLVALMFYVQVMITFTTPLILFAVYFYEPFVLHLYWLPLIFLSGKLLIGLAGALDYKFRDPKSVNWIYKPVVNMITGFILPWLLFPALWTYRRNQWLTRSIPNDKTKEQELIISTSTKESFKKNLQMI